MTVKKIKLTPTMEDYLEAIYCFIKKQHFARISEIAKKLNVKSPTVNTAIKNLIELGLATQERYGYVCLTKEGELLGSQIQSKHDILFRFLSEFLLLDKNKAQKEACLIEHSISQETFDKLTKLFSFIEDSYNGKQPDFLKKFKTYLKIKEKA